MNPTVLFLTSLGQAFSAGTLYGDDHPMRQAATDRVLRALNDVLVSGTPLRLSFIDNEVISGARAITDLRGWEWAGRLSDVGIQRLEIGLAPLTSASDVEAMLAAIKGRLQGPGGAFGAWARGAIRFGPLAIAGGGGGSSTVMSNGIISTVADAIAATGLQTELDGVEYIHAEAEAGRVLPMHEADTIVRSLACTMRREQHVILPLLDIREVDEYTTTHCCNVAMLSMGIADELGLSDADTRAIGTAALLHDIGKVRIPKGLLTKPGMLSPAERKVIETHPVEGARILTGRGLGNSLAATVAYEHHIWFNGKGGYPKYAYPRQTHFASRIVHVADIYDAICSKRPYRDPWPRVKAIQLIQKIAGVELDSHIAEAFVSLANRATETRTLIEPQLV